MPRLLALATYPLSAAATRFRIAQFFPALAAAGIEAEVRPFLDERDFAVLYERGHVAHKSAAALRAIAGRIGDVIRAANADVVFVQREAALVGPPVFEWLVTQAIRRPLIFDLDDPIWIPVPSPTYGATLSRLLKFPEKTNFTLRAATHVVAGNPVVAEYAARFNDSVSLVPTVVDTDQFRPRPRPLRDRLHVGWIGTFSTIPYLASIVPALRRVYAARPFRLVVSGGVLPDTRGLDVEHRPWTMAGEPLDFASLDIGLYPLIEDAWSVGKSGFKAVEYMATGVPAIASPVGVVRQMIRDEHNGLYATDEKGWEVQLLRLLDDPALRQRLSETARQDAVASLSLAAHAPRFVRIVERALAGRRGSVS